MNFDYELRSLIELAQDGGWNPEEIIGELMLAVQELEGDDDED